MTTEERVNQLESRVSHMEGVIEEIRTQMSVMNGRINTQIQLTVGMWVTTMLAVLAVLAAVLIKS